MIADFIVDWIEEEVILVAEFSKQVKEKCWEVYVDGASNANDVSSCIEIFNTEERMI